MDNWTVSWRFVLQYVKLNNLKVLVYHSDKPLQHSVCDSSWRKCGDCIVGEVYAIGGYNGVKTVDVVEKYNPEEGTWKEVSPLVFGRSVPGIAVAHLWPVQSTMKSFWEPESQL